MADDKKDITKKRINSKDKGSEYERKIAKVLSNWWGEQFHRTPASGGLHWKADNRVAGDIVTPPTSVFPWVTELKKRENWEFDQLLKNTGEFESYWDQVSQDSVRVNLRPLLIFSKNFAPNYMMIQLTDFNIIMEYVNGEDAINVVKRDRFNFFVVISKNYESRIICILEDFIKAVSKDDVIKAFGL